MSKESYFRESYTNCTADINYIQIDAHKATLCMIIYIYTESTWRKYLKIYKVNEQQAMEPGMVVTIDFVDFGFICEPWMCTKRMYTGIHYIIKNC